ncbi:TonB-dependent receptor [Bordetella sp. 02P26C-1]|uniref:TonB-dependent receptor n=1 Tax=Bordetella sp. 02P26C-1 TaxID=2683195 RepID=UPI0013543C1D|nr:TonB-dependent receptor [Bordetella sp. 02P26C-1]MVW78284.1 TonB-dependent receptor [Bordetella sp. 02P26C-1]
MTLHRARFIRKPPRTLLTLCGLLLPLIESAAQTAVQEAEVPTLAPVIVTSIHYSAALLDIPASVSVVDGERLRFDSPGIDLAEGLGGVPGLQIQDRWNYAQDLQLSIRGFGARSTFGVRGVRLYVDGIPATMPDGQGQTSNIDIASVERIEVLRGPFSALYGNSAGGVVQVFTEEGEAPPRLQAKASAGSYGTYSYGLKASGAKGDFDYVLSVNRLTTDGYREHSAARKNLGNAKLGLQLDDNSRLTVIVNSVDVKAQDPLGLTRAQYEDDPRQATPQASQYNTRKTVRQTQGGLLYERQIDADNELRAMVYFGQRDMTQYLSIPPAAQLNPGHAGGVIGLKRQYGGLDLRWTTRSQLAGQPLTLVAGLGYDSLHEDRKGYENFTGPPFAPTDLGVKGRLRRDETNRVYNIDPYVQASWNFAPRWTLDAGLRYSTVKFDSDDHYLSDGNADDSGSARYRRALPVTSLRYALTPSSSLYASYGQGFETPTTNEVSYRPDGRAGLNLGLKPAISDNYEIGYKSEAGQGLFSLAIFHTETRNEIVAAENFNGRTSYRNAGRTRRSGIEAAWSGRVASDWRADLAYTWINARYRDNVSDSGIRSGNRIPGIAQHMLYGALAWAPEQGWRAGVEGRFMGKVYVDDANSDSAAGYFVASLSTGYRWQHRAWTWDAYARVDNLFNREYIGSVIVNDGNGRYFEPAAGRNWSAGLVASYAF